MADRLYDSAAAFENALMDAVEQFETDVSVTVRKSLVDLTSNVIQDTPRDTGRAAAGWNLTAGRPSDDVPPEDQYQTHYGEKVPANAPPPAQDPGDAENNVWYIVNNVEHVSHLEDGSSNQAPQGMLSKNLTAMAQILSRHASNTETLE